MNAHTIYKIAIRLFLGSALSVALNPVMALTPSQLPLTVGSAGAKPNIMIMLDKSGSMGSSNTITITPAANISPNDMATKDPTFDYPCSSAISAGKATEAAVNSTDAMKINSSGVVKFCKVGTSCGSSNQYDFGTAAPQKCFNNDKWYKVKYYDGSTLENKAFLGKNLNWYFSTGGFPTGNSNLRKSTAAIKTTRMIIAKDAVRNLVTSLLNDKAAVRLGLSTFDGPDSNDDYNGGQLLVAMGDLNDAQAALITTAIGTGSMDSQGNDTYTGMQPSGFTPLAETLTDIARYFTTGYTGTFILPSTGVSYSLNELFTNNKVNGLANNTSPRIDPLPAPIQYACQKSAVILATDGEPTEDTNISSFLRNYSGSRTPIFSFYLDDVAQAFFEMDLRPDSSTVKNNLKTYAIGIADPSLATYSVLNEAALRGGGTFEFADDYQKLSESLNKMVADIQKGVGSFSAIVANSTQLGTDAALFQAKYDTTDWTGDFLALPVDTNGIVGDPAWNAGSRIPLWNSTDGTSPRNIFTTSYHSTTFTPTAVSFKGKTGVTICNELLTDLDQKTALGIATCAASDSGVRRLDYLRGDTRYEQVSAKATYTDPRASNGTPSADRIFRNRARFYGDNPPAPHKAGEVYKKDDGTTPADPWLLGDIVNSDGVYVSNQNQGYDKLAGMSATEKSAYQAFVTNKDNRRKMVYIGANDAMLHGFDARTSTTDPESGKEILAYMPNSVFDANGRLKSLPDPDYAHKYFVDGSPKAGDVYFDNVWHTVLVGTTGAGGHGVFALDVTDPKYDSSEADHFPVSYNKTVLWEISDTDAPNTTDVTDSANNLAGNMGYTLTQASIVKMANDSWVAIVANGYGSSNNQAVLFIIDIKTGHLIKTINTGVGSSTQPNGLSTPFVADVNADGVADAIYAGDLLGNMWKFDVSSPNKNNWEVAYNKSGVAAPLFIACSNPAACDTSRQPITSKPVVGGIKSPQTTGVMVYFGTGKYFEEGDHDTTDTQSFYGIWDECKLVKDTTGSHSCPTTVLKNDTILQKQSITDETPVIEPTVRVTSQTATDYASKKGWYMDFINPNTSKNEGERVVSTPLLRAGRVIFVTFIPKPADNADPCSGGSGTSWLMLLDAVSGSRLTDAAFDINGDRQVTSADLVGGSTAASGLKLKGASKTPSFIKDSATKGKSHGFVGDSSGADIDDSKIFSEPSASTAGAGRQSWRQLE